ncbi:MAG: hypothetical protein RLZ09_2224, partial [Pseudomonadota bacterium]
MKSIQLIVAVFALLLSCAAKSEGVDFVQPKDGDTVTSTFTAKFSVDGKTLAKSNTETPGTGHFHLLINA